MNIKTCLIIGTSHVEAIRQGSSADKQTEVQIINLNRESVLYDSKKNQIHLDKIEFEADYVFMSIGGNTYNNFGLLESPIPITVCDNSIHLDEVVGRFVIPREMMADHFRSTVNRFTQHIEPISEYFPDAIKYHLAAPPPIGPSRFLKNNPGNFGPRIHMGVAPKDLRLSLYNLQKSIYKEICEKLGVAFLEPPKSSKSKQGFLKKCYRKNDPTHANGNYGALVWKQLEECMR